MVGVTFALPPDKKTVRLLAGIVSVRTSMFYGRDEATYESRMPEIVCLVDLSLFKRNNNFF